RPESSRSGSRPESLFESVGAGLGYLRRRTGHTTLLAIGALVNLCMVPAFSLLPLLVVEQGGGAARLGGMTSIFGAGTLAGGVLLGLWGGFHRRIHTTALGLLGAGLATVALALAPSAGLALAAVAAVGLAIPLVNGPIQALLQATIAADYQGRVFTLYGSVCAMMTPIGLAAAAPIADWLGVRAWFVAGGTICLGMALLGALSPSLRRIEEADAVGAAVLRQQS
ncbi:MAG TPA: MFS transporter, partial [Candidatus Polarisedimenticolaceae bacterium]|nr:MFS transporter [Candidatus Polarisedimenticolaceae bacterium]